MFAWLLWFSILGAAAALCALSVAIAIGAHSVIFAWLFVSGDAASLTALICLASLVGARDDV